MPNQYPCYDPDDPKAVECYRTALRVLKAAEVDFLVGGAYAFARVAGTARHTKDLDLFLRPADRDRALATLAAVGYQTEVTYPHWLAKAKSGEFFIDLIYDSGNGATRVDEGWFTYAVAGEVLGQQVKLCPPEECLWSKAFVMDRDRYDGADLAHILRAASHRLDWGRLLGRFGSNWRVLHSHLILFGFIYPAERDKIPAWVMEELAGRLRAEVTVAPPVGHICQGTLLSATQYCPDVREWGYEDARQPPYGSMTPEEVAVWEEGVRAGR